VDVAEGVEIVTQPPPLLVPLNERLAENSDVLPSASVEVVVSRPAFRLQGSGIEKSPDRMSRWRREERFAFTVLKWRKEAGLGCLGRVRGWWRLVICNEDLNQARGAALSLKSGVVTS
jgi:hypothetical protein